MNTLYKEQVLFYANENEWFYLLDATMCIYNTFKDFLPST